jgi:hypothetical protein
LLGKSLFSRLVSPSSINAEKLEFDIMDYSFCFKEFQLDFSLISINLQDPPREQVYLLWLFFSRDRSSYFREVESFLPCPVLPNLDVYKKRKKNKKNRTLAVRIGHELGVHLRLADDILGLDRIDFEF